MRKPTVYEFSDPDDALPTTRDEEDEGLRRLVCAMIERAVMDAEGRDVIYPSHPKEWSSKRKAMASRATKAEHIHKALGWIMDDSPMQPGARCWTFRHACQLVDLDADAMRSGIRMRLRKHYGVTDENRSAA